MRKGILRSLNIRRQYIIIYKAIDNIIIKTIESYKK